MTEPTKRKRKKKPTRRKQYSPFYSHMRVKDGFSLLEIVTYSCVPRILIVMRLADRPMYNRDIARETDLDESQCLKLVKWLASNAILFKDKDKGHCAYTLTGLGQKCADALLDITCYGEGQFGETKRGLARILDTINESEELKA